MEATYNPIAIEKRWYEAWVEAGVFAPEYRPGGEPFCIVIPPPNVTGALHIGHALNLTIQDVLVRRKRMQGFAALWVPGTDHAGIATQNVVERDLAVEGIDRHDIGRRAFVDQVWEWKRRYGNRINKQIRRMGASVDWGRERFTMDEGLSKAVREVFVRLYEEDLIYRGNRIINWCPRCHTALADIEVEYEDEIGELVSITYPFADGSGGITVATTRAETMLGDTGVAVHPDDARYIDSVGKTLLLPLVGREIPVVADEFVDPEFGTGAVKVTPAHDPNDFEMGARHGLEAVTIMDEAAVITAAGPFDGLNRFEARIAVKDALAAAGALETVEEHQHSVGHCYRCRTVVEPYLSLQWFVKVKPLTEPAIEAVKDGATTFVPRRWENSYFHWMENLRDWCISRQIWWGHRIPAWYCDCGAVIVAREDPESCAECGGAVHQDEDVLDTWFSSALWPFSTLGWPEQTADLATFYPNSVLVTGFDIIYFWVARMMQMGIHFMGEAPFTDLAITGLVRDAEGRKMSKSIGNSIDPLDVADEHGVDPLRLALLQAASPGQDVPLDLEWVIAARRFGNKLWNGLRFGLSNLDGAVPSDGGYPTAPEGANAWILARLFDVTERFDELCDSYRFSDAFGLLYNFTWSELFDWYVEMSKPLLRDPRYVAETKQTLGAVLRDVLKLFHPAMPFLTEELWSELVGDGLLAGAAWPQPPAVAFPGHVEILQGLVTGVRQFRSTHGISPRQPLTVEIVDPDGVVADWWHDQLEALAAVTLAAGEERGSGYTRLMSGNLQGFIRLAGLIDVDAEAARIQKALDAHHATLAKSKGKLGNASFTDQAPQEVVEKERMKAAEAEEAIAKLERQLGELGG